MNDRSALKMLPDLECACASARRAARLVTQLYDEEFGRQLESSQFTLLSALYATKGLSQSSLAKVLGLDKTTLSRNLSLLAKKGWVERQTTEDQRERGYRLTAAGRGLLKSAKPAWRRAQRRLRSAMSGDEWEQMQQVIRALTHAAQRALIARDPEPTRNRSPKRAPDPAHGR